MRNALLPRPSSLAMLLTVLAVFTITPSGAQPKYKTEIVPYTPHGDQIQDVRLTIDGTRLITYALQERSLKVWELQSRRLIRTIDANVLGSTGWLDVTSNGRYMVTTHGDGSLHVIDLDTGGFVRSIAKDLGERPNLTITPNGQDVITGRGDGILQLWDLATGRLKLQFGDTSARIKGIYDVVTLPDSGSILVPYQDGTVKQWSLSTGHKVRTFAIDANNIAVAPDGQRFVSRDVTSIKIWNLATGQLERNIEGVDWSPGGVQIDRLGRYIFVDVGAKDHTRDEGKIEIREFETGKLVRTLNVGIGKGRSFAISDDGRRLVQGSVYAAITVWDTETGQLVERFGFGRPQERSAAFTSDGNSLVVFLDDGTIQVWNPGTGELVRSLQRPGTVEVCDYWKQGTLIIGARHAICADAENPSPRVWDIDTGKFTGLFKDLDKPTPKGTRTPVLSATKDGRYLFSSNYAANGKSLDPGDQVVRQWDIKSGRIVRRLQHAGSVTAIGVSPDGRYVLTHDGQLKLWGVADGKLLRSVTWVGKIPQGGIAFVGDTIRIIDSNRVALLDTRNLRPIKDHPHSITRGKPALTEDGMRAAIVFFHDTWKLELWDLENRKLLRSFKGLPTSPRFDLGDVAIAPGGTRIVVPGMPTGIGVWDAESGDLLMTAYSGQLAQRRGTAPQGEWLTITPEGFFAASSPRAAELASVVRGAQPYSVEQMWQSLFSPDLVREKLGGDTEKEVVKAAGVMDLGKVLDSGKSPSVVITSHSPGASTVNDIVTMEATIADQGGGIGRVEWRVNGVTAAVTAKTEIKDRQISLSHQLALDPGENTIEVIAYNARNLLASPPVSTTMRFTGSVDTVKPKLHVLAIGINEYVDRGWTPPGADKATAFPPLNLAVSDAVAFSTALKAAGAGQYAEVAVTEAMDKDATVAGLEERITRMAAGIHPRDTFVLFAAAHGTSVNGRFFLIPQDYDGGTNPLALQERAIGQDRLQDWVANRIKAKRAILLLDTCESGALVSGFARSRTDVPASEAAIGRLHEATGRPVLTAAAEGKPAFEGYEGYGIFTWALLDALKNGDRNGNGSIELSELVAHVQDGVPQISARLKGRGHAAVAARGSTSDRQSARFGSRGEDFALVKRLQ
jgi:WD40 repeat protein